MLREIFDGRIASFFIMLGVSSFCLTGLVAANPAIGVTAALRGEVVRTASFSNTAAIGQMSSGQQVFLGDDIKVGKRGRLQVMLLDETIFTLGANSVMRIDEFVFDPTDGANNSLSTTIKQGAFRFVSGQVARNKSDAMTVKLPAATIGVRGTSVAGEVDENGAAQVILLGPAPDNSLGLPAGAINVANEAGVVDITRPGFVTEITNAALPPAPPKQATAAQIRQLEQALSEEAVSELAEGLGVESTEIVVQQGDDSDGDGQLDRFAANENLSKAILSATGEDGGVTNDAELLDQVVSTLFGDQLNTLSTDERADMVRGANLGEDAGNLLAGDFDYLGPTTLSDLASFGPNGSVTFTGSNATMTDLSDENVGTFSMTQIWDFASDSVSTSIGGNFDMSGGDLGRVVGTFDPNEVQRVRFDEARGAAMAGASISFSSFQGNETEASFNASVGGSVYDRNENVVIAGETYTYFPAGTELMSAPPGMVNAIVDSEDNVSAFATLSNTTQSALESNSNSELSFHVNINVNSFLSNVDRKDGAASTASVGEGMVDIRVMSDTMNGDEPTLVNKAQGSIFAMKRTVTE